MSNNRYRIIEGPESIQGSKEWHDFRKDKIGASMAPVIMGESPFQTPLQLWEEIVLGTPKTTTPAMERGIRLESKAREWLKQYKGELKPVVLQSIAHPNIIASLDGYRCNEGGTTIVEIKCPGLETHLKAIEGKIPPHYRAQMQHQMDLVGVDVMLYVSFDGTDGVMIPCYRDEEYCQKLFQAELAFLASILRNKAPDPIEKDWVNVSDWNHIQKAYKYQELKGLIGRYEQEAEKLKGELIAASQHPRSKIGPLKLQKVIRKGSVDYESILQEYGIYDTDKYRKESIETWRLS